MRLRRIHPALILIALDLFGLDWARTNRWPGEKA